MFTTFKLFLASRRSGPLGLLLAGGILFVIGFGGPGALLDVGPRPAAGTDMHARA